MFTSIVTVPFRKKYVNRNTRLRCTCSGYWFPHRRGGGACEESKSRDITLALRYKDEDALIDAQIEYSLKYCDQTSPVCPF